MFVTEVPAGFYPFDRKSPVTEPWEPIYCKRTPEAVILAVRLAKAHTNARGFAHGGFISALADNAMGNSLVVSKLDTERQSAVTVNLSVDFLGSAQIGQWVEFTTAFIKAGSTLCFTQCFVTADGVPVARANATFRVVDRTG
ncbi:MAG: PaaI family thioesterase [Xanthobacteraceae bacterium]|nr:PaaI family thioesterase [Xanthobacteraceae bacterium]MBX3522685.1 PaaI family thioesterase [Xanthobacteraceae bacterium]MBX3535362.1 PaaI family thioesterase [Xanthobacteraceae bacterium]MCW5674735.1 PaaI family thioesterase [Xanthobacteraceae bacterium]MCW5677085.1 PaaI family thioesterase [Xanthobacteraceae bacterium]